MKIVLYTQRVDIIEAYDERRDCSDQNIPRFLSSCGYLPISVPNIQTNFNMIVDRLKPAGIVLTGGNSLLKYGGEANERDETDKRMIEIALDKDIPLYGFCRGMQSILDYFGCRLSNVANHVAVRHSVSGELGERLVNSYHNQGAYIDSIKEPLIAVATSKDGVVEAISHKNNKIFATMWHPEREKPFNIDDIMKIKEMFL